MAEPFLTAEWRELVLVQFEIDPHVVAPFVPAGCELDDWQGRHLVSLVGFRFQRSRLAGLYIPFYRDFPEVNLRCYVRREVAGELRRGVVFIKEYAPPRLAGWVARWIYNENYHAPRRMTSQWTMPTDDPWRTGSVAYRWEAAGGAHEIACDFRGAAELPARGGHDEFIVEHYWGYGRSRRGRTLEYRVAHAPWRVWGADDVRIYCDATALYGSPFAEALAAKPYSAIVAAGSPVEVYPATTLAPQSSAVLGPIGAK